MHDRKDPRPPEVIALGRHDSRRKAASRARRRRGSWRACARCRARRSPRWRASPTASASRPMRLDPDARRQVEWQLFRPARLLEAAGVVGDAVDRHAVCRRPGCRGSRPRAVIWYSGVPTLRPARSSGRWIPLAAFTKMQECRKKREGNTGMAMNGRSGRNSDTTYEDSDISADLELLVPQHAEERLLHRQVQVGEVDAVRLDRGRRAARSSGRSSSTPASVSVSTRQFPVTVVARQSGAN